MTNQHPKQLARDEIDARLRIAGWAVQPRGAIDPFAFLLPSVLQDTTARSLRTRLRENLPPLDARSLCPADAEVIRNLKTNFGESRPRAVIQLATGAGKTYTAATFMYRLLKFADANRVLFFVDTRNLGDQTHKGFTDHTPSNDNWRLMCVRFKTAGDISRI